ncbi:glycoside hydrolase domain-containing protein [Archangium violaceum]|uniref:glycoside hydrolase domain-containing protein n=1 Tax=Archangium violaceum TaxID=83451 RepID=UPI001EF6AC97|nr:glycoside hydrolase domain-containing protein [Archangium violaceum]
MEKVRPQTPPESNTGVRLVAARNEFVSFQVGLHGGSSGWSGVHARFPVLDGPMLIEGADIVLYREALVPIHRASTVHTATGLWPDGLIPDVDETVGEKRLAFPLDVPANESRALWVDVHVPLYAPPGEYHGTLEVWGNGYSTQVSVSLTVLDVEMPSTASLRTHYILWSPSVCKAFTGERECSREVLYPLLSSFQRMGLEHRVSLSSQFDPDDIPDWDTFDAWWSPFFWGTAPLRLPGARMTSLQYLGPQEPERISRFATEADARGWLSLAFNFVADEPPYHSNFDQVRTRASQSRQVAPRLRTLLTSNERDVAYFGATDHIDILVVAVNFIDGLRAPFVGDQRSRYESFLSLPNRELWLYQSCLSHGCGAVLPENAPSQGWPSYMIDRPAAKARAMEWVSFLSGAAGEHYYQVAEMLSTAWTDQYTYAGNGDGTLFYPGTVSVIGGTTDVPLPSMRLKLIRLGLQDYEWLKMVSDAGDPAFARRVARELIPAAWRVPDDGRAFERARLRLIRRYLELVETGIPPVVAEGIPEPTVSAPSSPDAAFRLAQ